jgi:transposase
MQKLCVQSIFRLRPNPAADCVKTLYALSPSSIIVLPSRGGMLMRYIEGYCRTQRLFWPDLLDDSVTEEKPVRFMDAYGERLDRMSLGVAQAQAAFTGRPADDPWDWLTLSVDGYLNRIRSSRRLERESHRHVERIGLLRKLRPDFKTRADFRKHNTKALQALFREFGLLGAQLDLFGAELLAIDGSQFKAVHNNHKNFTQAKLERALKASDAPVEQDLRDLDAADSKDSSVHQPTSEALQKKIESRQERQKRDRGVMEESTASGEPPLSLTAPARRSMPKSPKGDVGTTCRLPSIASISAWWRRMSPRPSPMMLS